MKNRIRQILREETSGFDPKMLEQLYKFMNHLTKDYKWYYDTPELRFEHSPGSIWLINPETKEWVLELEKDGRLLWYWKVYLNFKRYFNMERSDFESFIKLWVEYVFKREVNSTSISGSIDASLIEDVLNNGKQLK